MKTILLHIRADNGMESRLQAAFDLSRATGAHISCLQIAPLPELVAADLYGSGYLVPEAIDAVRRQDEEMRRALEERLRREGMAWDWHYRSGDLVQGLLETGRLADAMLVSLPPPGRRQADDPAPIVADLAVNSRAPVLAIPSIAKGFRCTGRAMVAWDGSHEAASALTASRTLLRVASEVHVVTVDERSKRDFPPTDAAEYLSRHGIAVEIHEWPRKDRSVEEALSHACQELSIDWMVMGAFGHSRLRETIFGGVTRYILAETRVPLLLAH